MGVGSIRQFVRIKGMLPRYARLRPKRARRWLGIVALCVTAGCAAHPERGARETPISTRSAEPRPLDAAALAVSPRDERPATGAQSILVAGCNVECAGCSVIDSGTFVIGQLEGSEQPLFAGPPEGGGPHSCSAGVRVGETIVLEAHASPKFEFVQWRLFGPPHDTDYCPCAGSSDPICRVSIDAPVTSQYTRIYCGAVWRLKQQQPLDDSQY